MKKESNIKTFIYTLKELDNVVENLYLLFDKCSIFVFSGDLGSGKTTIIKRLLKRLGINEVTVSPTFLYVVQYFNQLNQKFNHFDLYRIGNLEEFESMGFSELLYEANSWSFIEWPEIILPILNKNVCLINIEYYGENKRKLTYEIK